MAHLDYIDTEPKDYELTNLTSLDIAFFDVRNWYACLSRFAQVGERVLAQCWNVWNSFLDSMQLFNENEACTCCRSCEKVLPSNRPEPLGTSQNTPFTITRQVSNSAGSWIFVPNLNEHSTNENVGTTAKCQNHPNVGQGGQGTTSSAGSRKRVSFSLPVSSRKSAAKSKYVTAKKTTTPKKLSPHSQKTPKSKGREAPDIERSLPLIYQRPKRQSMES